MGITIKFKGLADGPILLTPEARTGPTDGSAKMREPTPRHLNSRGSDLRIALRQIEQERVLAEVDKRISALSRSLDNLHVPASDVVQPERTAVSPQPQSLSAQADGQATVPATHSVEVRWPSQGRTVYSGPLNPVAEVDISHGTYTLKLNIAEKDFTVDVAVNNGAKVDTNEDMLRRVARAIDGLDSRVKAEVETIYQDAYQDTVRSRPMNKMMRLKITSTEDGAATNYYLSDESGDLAQALGMDVAQPRRPARMLTGGVLRDQTGDTLSLDNGHLSVQAKTQTRGTAQIQVSQGVNVIAGDLNQVITQYNNLVGYLDLHSELLRPSLKDRIVRPLEERARSMPALGLFPKASGRLGTAPNLDQRLTADFAGAREILFSDTGWTQALQAKLGQIQDTELIAFASPLDTSFESERRRMWEAVDELAGASIVSGYY